jgi:hypothetical protein
MQWQVTFDDEMNSVNTSLWNGGYATDLWCNGGACPQNYAGLSISGGILSIQSTVNYSHFTDLSGRAAENSNGEFSQKYGYFEWRAKLPHDNAGEGDGLWPALFAFPVGKSGFPGDCTEGNEEADVVENVLGVGNLQQVHFSVHDQCFNGFTVAYPTTPVGDLSTAYHAYGLYWRNDGPPHGSMQVYFDGTPQGAIHVLDASSALWDNGIYLLNQMIPCPSGNVPFFGGAPCRAATSNANPFLLDYTRAWELVPN